MREHLYERIKRDTQMHIYFGQQCGMSEALAFGLKQEARSRYITADVLSLQNFTPEVFGSHALVILFVATTGDGDPTVDAINFNAWISDPSCSKDTLKNTHFAVFGLGDRSYPKFDRLSEMTDINMARLGAYRICPRGFGDDGRDIKEDFLIWQPRLWLALEERFGQVNSNDEVNHELAEPEIALLNSKSLEGLPPEAPNAGSLEPTLEGKVVGLFVDARKDSKAKLCGNGFQRERSKKVAFNAHGQCGVGLQELLTKSRRLDEAAVRNRAVLIQSTHSYSEILGHFPQHAYTLKINDAMSWNGFAENILVCDIGIDDVCIGDIWRFGDTNTGLELKVCTPRRPCPKVDKAHGSKSSHSGINIFCLQSGLAGWFCQVFREGTARQGDRLQCVQREYPGWTIRRVAATVYGHTLNANAINLPSTQREDSLLEMQRLAEITDLGEFEWRTPLLRFLATQPITEKCEHKSSVVSSSPNGSALVSQSVARRWAKSRCDDAPSQARGSRWKIETLRDVLLRV